MKVRSIAAWCAALACAAAHAASWDVRYSNMPDSWGNTDTVDLMFSGADGDGDGFIAEDEVSAMSLEWAGSRFQVVPLVDGGPCDIHAGIACTSSLDDFSFSLNSQSVQSAAAVGFGPSGGLAMDTGLGTFATVGVGPTMDMTMAMITVIPQPVPEPATAMLALLGLGAFGTRRPRKAANRALAP